MTGRREFLAAVGTAGVAATGGCLSRLLDRSTPCRTGDIGIVEGTWGMAGGGPDHAGRANRGPPANAVVGWCASVPSADQYTAFPAVADGTVYAGIGAEGEANAVTAPDRLLALDAATGERRWATPTLGSFVGAPAVTDGLVIAALATNSGGIVQAFDAEEGSERWRANLGAPVGGPPTAADGSAFLADGKSRIHAYEATDGSRQWRAPLDGGTEDPSDRNFVDERNETVDPTEATGTGSSGSEPPLSFGGIGWPVTVTGGTVVVASPGLFSGTTPGLFAFDARTGEHRWQSLSFADGMVAAADGTIVATGMGKQVVAVDAADGRTRWSVETEAFQATPPGVGGSTVYVGGDRLSAFDLGTGEERWRADVTTEDSVQPVVTDDAVYAFDGDRLAVVGTDGTVRGSIEGPLSLPAAVTDGTLFGVTGLRRLAAFVPSEGSEG